MYHDGIVALRYLNIQGYYSMMVIGYVVQDTQIMVAADNFSPADYYHWSERP